MAGPPVGAVTVGLLGLLGLLGPIAAFPPDGWRLVGLAPLIVGAALAAGRAAVRCGVSLTPASPNGWPDTADTARCTSTKHCRFATVERG
ncbi:MAG: hypothetical protein ACK5OX_06040 [Desertimonas sp.]